MCAVKSVVPSFGQPSDTDLGAGHQLLVGDHEVVEGVAAVGVVRVDVGDLLGRAARSAPPPTAQVTPSADWMLVMRKVYFGFGTALSNRKSVQPSTKIVSRPSSSATGPSAGVLPLEMTPVNMSIFSESFIRRSSLTLASVPAFSSAVIGLDLALAEDAALRVDLLGGQDVALERGLAEHRGGAGEEGHVTELEGRGRDVALRCGGLRHCRADDRRGRPRLRRPPSRRDC